MAGNQGGKDGAPHSAGARLLRNPTVIAAIVGAAIAGVFGTIQVIIPLVDSWRSEPVSPETPRAARQIPDTLEFPTASLPDLMQRVRRALSESPNDVPMEVRLRAISALANVAQTGVPAGFYPEAARILVGYMEQVAGTRRHVDDAFSDVYGPDPRVTRPHSIVEALIALDVIRDASPRPMPVRIGSIDFSYIDLSELDLSGFDASHGTFLNAFLSACDCRGTVFDHADLRRMVAWELADQPVRWRVVHRCRNRGVEMGERRPHRQHDRPGAGKAGDLGRHRAAGDRGAFRLTGRSAAHGPSGAGCRADWKSAGFCRVFTPECSSAVQRIAGVGAQTPATVGR